MTRTQFALILLSIVAMIIPFAIWAYRETNKDKKRTDKIYKQQWEHRTDK